MDEFTIICSVSPSLGSPRNSINAIENDRFDPSLPLAFRIADAFSLSVEEVFDKTDV